MCVSIHVSKIRLSLDTYPSLRHFSSSDALLSTGFPPVLLLVVGGDRDSDIGARLTGLLFRPMYRVKGSFSVRDVEQVVSGRR